jgi:outer membrane protein, heavy metal efflux system
MRRRLSRSCAALVFANALVAVSNPVLAQPAVPPSAAPGAPGAQPAPPTAGGVTMERAVGVALQRNRDVVAARLEIEAAEVDRVAAGLYWNPQFFYTVGNVTLGDANRQPDPNTGVNAVNPAPGPFSQLVQSIGVSEVVDVWAKRSARIKAADLGIELRRLRVEDALREIVFAVRAAFTDLVREQQERELSFFMKTRYDETVRLAQAKMRAGDISEVEGQKFELEGLRYRNALIEAETELELARQRLAALMGLPSVADIGGVAVSPLPPRAPLPADALVARALQERPDLRAARKGQVFADAMLASAEREGFPDISLGAMYTHSGFTVSGDNPNALAFTVALPLPLFDRNQAGIARQRVEAKRVVNDTARLELLVRHDVMGAVRRVDRARQLLDVYEGGLISRAENQLDKVEKALQAGHFSLLELLEAQRTFIETRAQYLRVQDDLRKAMVEVAHAVGREP